MPLTKVVNCKVNYIRPQFKNLEEWINDPNNVYIGRPGIVFINGKRFPSKGSPFANPYKTGTREENIKNYEIYIKNKLKNEPQLQQQLKNLKGKNLGCWCKPEACHGDVLLSILSSTD